MIETLPEKSLELVVQENAIAFETRNAVASNLSVLAVASTVVLFPAVVAAEYGSSLYEGVKKSSINSKMKGAISKEISYLNSAYSAFKRGAPRLKI